MTTKHAFHRPDLEIEDMAATQSQLDHDLKRIIAADAVILDVGANRGQFAEGILAHTSNTRIFCFEPVPAAYEELQSLAQTYHQITPVNCAVAITDGQATFFVTASDVGSSLLQPLPRRCPARS